MPRQARMFRIEATMPGAPGPDRQEEILAAIADLQARFGDAPARPSPGHEHEASGAEAAALRGELDSIGEAIARTKAELAALEVGDKGREVARLTDELSAVARGTEQATESVLQAAETIDRAASELHALLTQSGNIALADDIREAVVCIFEACNFQDLVGQRIAKVIATMGFIEERVEGMRETWLGMQCLGAGPVVIDDVEILDDGEAEMVPANRVGHASQSDIDAMFAEGE